MDKKEADHLQKQTKELYTLIANHYSKTPGRSRPRPLIQEKLKDIKKGSKVLDVGCGNGISVLELPDNVKYMGIDTCKAFIEIAKNNYPDKNFIYYDKETLPCNENTFDWVLCIATLHHIPSKEKRKIMVKELKRVTKKGGKILVTVWDQWNIHFAPFIIKNILKKSIGLSTLDWKDCFYSWKDPSGEIIGDRYFHAFTLKELNRLFENEGIIIKDKGNIQFRSGKFNNYYLLAEK